MTDEDRYIRITLRIPRDLHARLDGEANRTSKSLNAEIVARLEDSFVEGSREHPVWLMLHRSTLESTLMSHEALLSVLLQQQAEIEGKLSDKRMLDGDLNDTVEFTRLTRKEQDTRRHIKAAKDVLRSTQEKLSLINRLVHDSDAPKPVVVGNLGAGEPSIYDSVLRTQEPVSARASKRPVIRRSRKS